MASFGHASKFQRISRLGFVTAATWLNGGQPNFAVCLAVSWAGRLYIHFPRLSPRNRILPHTKFTLRPTPAFSYIGNVAARAVGVSESLRHRTKNGIMELLQRAPPIFGWAAITLGIGPHSSLTLFSLHMCRRCTFYCQCEICYCYHCNSQQCQFCVRRPKIW